MGARTGLFVPMLLRDRAIGVISAHDKRAPMLASRRRRPAGRGVRLARSRRRRPLRAGRADALRRVVGAQELERRRLARELHDETGQALTSILLGLKGVEDADDPADCRRDR